MTLPALITVKGLISSSAGPQSGRIVWARSTQIQPTSPGDETYLIPEEIVTVIGADGVLEQQLYSTNDPAASPTGWTWEVRVHFAHWHATFDIAVPYDAADGEIDFNRIAPVPADGDGQLYALVNHTHSGGGGGGDSITADQISDSGTTGRALVRSAIASTARTALGLGGAAILSVGTTSGDVAAGNAAAGLLATHTAAADPHPQYLLLAEGTAAFDPIGAATTASAGALAAATAADASHVAASDPHVNYTRTLVSTTGTYAVATSAETYIGLADPGAVGVGSRWYNVDPTA